MHSWWYTRLPSRRDMISRPRVRTRQAKSCLRSRKAYPHTTTFESPQVLALAMGSESHNRMAHLGIREARAARVAFRPFGGSSDYLCKKKYWITFEELQHSLSGHNGQLRGITAHIRGSVWAVNVWVGQHEDVQYCDRITKRGVSRRQKPYCQAI
jgi:hypothetical protein